MLCLFLVELRHLKACSLLIKLCGWWAWLFRCSVGHHHEIAAIHDCNTSMMISLRISERTITAETIPATYNTTNLL